MKIRVLTKRPGQNPRSTWIENNLKNLQNYVGGYIETVTLSTDCVIICDEEGRLKGKEHNCTICGVDFVGDIIICGVKEDEFADLPIEYNEAKQLFGNLWRRE